LFKQNNFRNSEGKYETIDEKELTGEELKKELDNCLNDYKRISDEK